MMCFNNNIKLVFSNKMAKIFRPAMLEELYWPIEAGFVPK